MTVNDYHVQYFFILSLDSTINYYYFYLQYGSSSDDDDACWVIIEKQT